MSTEHALLPLAKQATKRAYAPYSKFYVGAAISTVQGESYLGCNVENGAYPVSLCAERNAITTAVTQGAKPGDILEVVIYVDSEEVVSPCGSCRQVMSEFMSQTAKVTSYNRNGDSKTWTVAQLLPDSFSLL
jgi:cytidine deaminase